MEKKPSSKQIQWWRKQREEARKAKDPNSEEESDSSTDEDDDAEGDNPRLEKDFFKTLSFVKSRDPRIYDQENKFYQSDDSSSDTEGAKKSAPNKAPKEKAMYLRDYERKIIVEKGGQYSEDESDGGVDGDSDEERDKRAASPTYVQEQKQIQESFHAALESEDDEDDGLVLTKKTKSKVEKDQEEADYKQWLMGKTDDDATENKDMGALRQYWVDPKLDEGEKFLRNYILNKEYISKEDSRSSSSEEENEEEEEEVGYSEEERILEEQDNFERKYNFRYEEPDAEFIKRYPRTVTGSVRRKDSSRAEQRKGRRDRKEEEKDKLKDELKRHKNVKKQEIMDKLDQLRAATGNAKVGFDVDDLEGDFDPAQHEQMMQHVFDNEYDAQEDGGLKPDFGDEFEGDENVGEWDEGEEYVGDGDEGENLEELAEEEEYEPHCDDPDFIMDADYDPSASNAAGSSKKKGKKNKKKAGFADVVKNERPVFDPDEKSFDDYMDEYYRLDYEDLIGDMPCRFNYRTVMPNDFGLSVEEVLAAKDKELNQWVSVKKTSQYRPKEEELHDLRLFRRRSQNVNLKQRIFQSLMEEEEKDDDDEEEENNADGLGAKMQEPQTKTPSDGTRMEPTLTKDDDEATSSKDRKKRKRKRKTAGISGTGEGDASKQIVQNVVTEKTESEDKTKNTDNVPILSRKAKTVDAAARREQYSSSSSSGESSSSEDEMLTQDKSLQSKVFKSAAKRQQEVRSSSSDESSSSEDERQTPNRGLRSKDVVGSNGQRTCQKEETSDKRTNKRSSSSDDGTSSSSEDEADKAHKRLRTEESGEAKILDFDTHKRKELAGTKKQVTSSSSREDETRTELLQHKTLHQKDADISMKDAPVPSVPQQGANQMVTSGGKKRRTRNKKNKQQEAVTDKPATSVPGGAHHPPATQQKSKHKKGPAWSSNPSQGHGKFNSKHTPSSKTFTKSGGVGQNSQRGGAVHTKQVYQSGSVLKNQKSGSKNNKGRQKARQGGRNVDPVSAMSDARLKAYGINPKKIKYQLEYQKQKLDKS